MTECRIIYVMKQLPGDCIRTAGRDPVVVPAAFTVQIYKGCFTRATVLTFIIISQGMFRLQYPEPLPQPLNHGVMEAYLFQRPAYSLSP